MDRITQGFFCLQKGTALIEIEASTSLLDYAKRLSDPLAGAAATQSPSLTVNWTRNNVKLDLDKILGDVPDPQVWMGKFRLC